MAVGDILIINPLSGGGRALEKFRRAVRSSSPQVRRSVEAVRKIILEKGKPVSKLADFSRCRRIFVCGGDGTVNSVVETALFQKSKHPIGIGVLPGGFGNAVPTMLGCPDLPTSLSLFLPKTSIKKVDVIETNLKERRLSIFALGVGLDAEIVHRRKRYLRYPSLSYAFATGEAVFTWRRNPLFLKMDHRFAFRVMVSQLIAANGPFYGFLQAAPKARIDDGKITVRLFRSRRDFFLNCIPRRFPLWSVDGLSCMDFKATSLEVKPVNHIHIDGDPFSVPDVLSLRVRKRAVSFLKIARVNSPNRTILQN